MLQAFKDHASLPVDADWTESDNLLKKYLLAATKFVEGVTNTNYQPTAYEYKLQYIHRLHGTAYEFKLPVYPVETITSFGWIDDLNNTGTFTQNTDFQVVGPHEPSPRIIFPGCNFQLPNALNTLYPYTLTFSTVANELAEVMLVAIFELAAFYFRFPEAMTENNPDVGPIFQSHLDLVTNHFL